LSLCGIHLRNFSGHLLLAGEFLEFARLSGAFLHQITLGIGEGGSVPL